MARYIVADGQVIWGAGDSPESAIEDTYDWMDSASIARDERPEEIPIRVGLAENRALACYEATDALYTMVVEQGGAHISWGQLEDGRLCTRSEEDEEE